MKEDLEYLKKRYKTWKAVGRALGITERYVYNIRHGKEPEKPIKNACKYLIMLLKLETISGVKLEI